MNKQIEFLDLVKEYLLSIGGKIGWNEVITINTSFVTFEFKLPYNAKHMSSYHLGITINGDYHNYSKGKIRVTPQEAFNDMKELLKFPF